MTPLERVTERVHRNGNVDDPATRRPLLTLEEFFEGNDVVGSICCNCPSQPAPRRVYEVLRRVRARPDVGDVRVAITMFDDPAWPFSDTVWVITKAKPAEVMTWFDEDLAPTECSAGFPDGIEFEHVDVAPGMQPVACWWD